MGLFNFFMPKSFEDIEAKADRLVQANDLGLARLEYEKALEAYNEIALKFSEETKPWDHMMELALIKLNRKELFDSIFTRALTNFKETPASLNHIRQRHQYLIESQAKRQQAEQDPEGERGPFSRHL